MTSGHLVVELGDGAGAGSLPIPEDCCNVPLVVKESIDVHVGSSISKRVHP